MAGAAAAARTRKKNHLRKSKSDAHVLANSSRKLSYQRKKSNENDENDPNSGKSDHHFQEIRKENNHPPQECSKYGNEVELHNHPVIQRVEYVHEQRIKRMATRQHPSLSVMTEDERKEAVLKYDYDSLRKRALDLVTNKTFQEFIVMLIILNSIMLGIATFDFVKENSATLEAFDVVDTVFLILFTVELCIQALAFGLGLFKDSWLIFDLILIVLSWSLQGVTIVRSFRIFRALRLFARVGALKRIVTAVLMTGPQMTAIGLVLGIVFYIFSVMITQLYLDQYLVQFEESYEDEYQAYFGRLDYTFLTLFFIMTTDNWWNVIRYTNYEFVWLWIAAIIFMLFTTFVVMNLIIAVLCESLSHLRDLANMQEEFQAMFGDISSIGNDIDWYDRELKKLKKSACDFALFTVQLVNKVKSMTTLPVSVNRNAFTHVCHWLHMHSSDVELNIKELNRITVCAWNDELKINLNDSKLEAIISQKSNTSGEKGRTVLGRDESKETGKTRSDSEDDLSDLNIETQRQKVKVDTAEKFEELRSQLRIIVQNDLFQSFVIFLIIVNSLMMGIATLPVVRENARLAHIFDVSDTVLLVLFTIELTLQFIVHGLHLFKDGWLLFDFITVVSSWAFAGVKIIRSFRIFRAFRLFGRVKSLKMVVKAILSAGSSMSAIALVLSLLSYIFAVLFTNLFGSLYEDGYFEGVDYFGRLDKSLLTLIIFLTMEGWATVTMQVKDRFWWAWIPLIAYLIISAFVVLSLFVAVICDAVDTLAGDDDDSFFACDHQDAPLYSILNELSNVNGMIDKCVNIQQDLMPFQEGTMPENNNNNELVSTARPDFLRQISVRWSSPIDGDESSTSIKENEGEYNSIFLRARKRIKLIVEDDCVQSFIIWAIVANSLLMGLGTFDFVKDNEKLQNVFDSIDLAFLLLFTLESGMQLIVHGYKLFYNGWLTFDFAIVILSWALTSIKIMRSLRIFRVFRLFGRVESLKRTVTAIGMTASQMGAIGIILVLVNYIYTVLCTQLFKGLYEEGYYDKDYFGRLDNTAFTLFMFLTLDDYSPIMRMTGEKYWWSWTIFLSYIIMNSFVVLNLVIAVLCDALFHLRDEGGNDDENVHRNQLEDIKNTLDSMMRHYVKLVHTLPHSEPLRKKMIELCINAHQLLLQMNVVYEADIAELEISTAGIATSQRRRESELQMQSSHHFMPSKKQERRLKNAQLTRSRGTRALITSKGDTTRQSSNYQMSLRSLIGEQMTLHSTDGVGPNAKLDRRKLFSGSKVICRSEEEISSIIESEERSYRASMRSLATSGKISDNIAEEEVAFLENNDQYHHSNESKLSASKDSLNHVVPFLGNEDSDEEDEESVETKEALSLRQRVLAFKVKAADVAMNSREYLSTLVENKSFQSFIILLILINSIIMGLQTFTFVEESSILTNAFETIDQIFLIIFTIELAVQIYVHRLKLFNDPWLVFDFVLILASWALSGVKVVRSFRIFRAFRLFGRVESMRRVLAALASVWPELSAITLLLLIIYYIFAVMFTQLFSGKYEEGCFSEMGCFDGEQLLDKDAFVDYGVDYFGRLDHTFFTLFMLTTLEDCGNVTRTAIQAVSWSWSLIVLFMIVVSYIVMNLIVAALCESLYRTEGQEQGDNNTYEFEGDDGEDYNNNNDSSDDVDAQDLESESNNHEANETLSIEVLRNLILLFQDMLQGAIALQNVAAKNEKFFTVLVHLHQLQSQRFQSSYRSVTCDNTATADERETTTIASEVHYHQTAVATAATAVVENPFSSYNSSSNKEAAVESLLNEIHVVRSTTATTSSDANNKSDANNSSHNNNNETTITKVAMV